LAIEIQLITTTIEQPTNPVKKRPSRISKPTITALSSIVMESRTTRNTFAEAQPLAFPIRQAGVASQ
jgi:hypothetical protein